MILQLTGDRAPQISHRLMVSVAMLALATVIACGSNDDDPATEGRSPTAEATPGLAVPKIDSENDRGRDDGATATVSPATLLATQKSTTDFSEPDGLGITPAAPPPEVKTEIVPDPIVEPGPTPERSPTPTPARSDGDLPIPTPPPMATDTPLPASTIPPDNEFPASATPVTPIPSPDSGTPPTKTPRPTSTPLPIFNEQFGVISGGGSDLVGYRLGELGMKWYIDFQPDPRSAPAGTNKVPFIDVVAPRIPISTLHEFASAVPGSVWYIGGEPNRFTEMSGTMYVDEFDYYVGAIRAADPTAKIMAASILNWEFTCTACGGFQQGKVWMTEFVDAYQSKHDGALPPVDIWAIDVYPLRWDEVPMIDWFTVTEQIEGFREYLDTELFRSGDPIWITEIASHWAYSAWTVDANGGITIPSDLDWIDDYQWDTMEAYLMKVVDWLVDHSSDMNIDKWFFFRDYADVTQAPLGDPYAGIYFFENAGIGSSLNQLGRVYRDYATGRR